MTLRYRRHPDLRLTALEGEGVVLHLGSREYFTVSETGLAILEPLEQARTLEELVDALVERYEVTRDQAADSVRSFLDRCLAENLVLESAEE
ncbi:MAG: PqqD family protein [Gemmatimonadales bacterium]